MNIFHSKSRFAPSSIELGQSPFNAVPVLKGHRVIFVLGSVELGGAERQALILARYLSETELAEVEIWGFNRLGHIAEICEQTGLTCRVISHPFAKSSRFNRFVGILRVGWTLRRARPDILLPYILVPNVICGLIWKMTGARLCVWNQRDEGIAHLGPKMENWAVSQIPEFISNSPNGARFLINKLKVEPSKVTVINNGVEYVSPPENRFIRRDFLQVDEKCFVACMIGNLNANKDHKTLLLAWRQVVSALKTKGRAALLVLAGNYDEAYESLAALTSELGIKESVRFPGFVTNIPKCLSAVDISIFSSHSEGCPNGILESMAAGLAVTGTNIDGIKEALGPGNAEFLAAPGDAEALAQIIVRLANNPALCSEIGAENQKRVRTKYDSVRMCKETVAVLAKFLQSRGV